MMNGFTAADMSTAAANGFRDGLAAQPAAAQEAVAVWTVTREGDPTFPRAYFSEAAADAMVAHITLAPFAVKRAPVAAAPVDDVQLELIGRRHFNGPAPQAWYAAARELLASTPAAPGIGLHAPCTEAVYALARKLLWVTYVWNDHNFDHPYKIARKLAAEFGIESFDQANAWLDEQSKLIDASPKGGSDACIWTDDGEGNWATACGEIFTLIEGVPAENKVHHCPYCGKNLQATSAEVGS